MEANANLKSLFFQLQDNFFASKEQKESYQTICKNNNGFFLPRMDDGFLYSLNGLDHGYFELYQFYYEGGLTYKILHHDISSDEVLIVS